MTVPVIEIQGIGPKTAEFLKSHGILTAEDLLKDGISCLQQVPGFSKNRAEQVLKVVATSPGFDGKSSSVKIDNKKDKKKSKNKKKDKKKSGKDKKKSDKKNNKKKGKNKKKGLMSS